jgi:DNA mismatch endonuclease (patch repair protein)
VCVFCDGEFWHGRNWERLRLQLERRANASYWTAKIARNRARDRSQRAQLRDEGWLVVRVWERDALRDPVSSAKRILAVVRSRQNHKMV